MSIQTNRGVLVVSIDLDSFVHSAGMAIPEASVQSLLALAGKHRVACTWCSTNPAASSAVTPILGDELDHEIALLAKPEWLFEGALRSSLIAVVGRLVLRAQSAGYTVSTLALPGEAATQGWEVMHKLGLTAVRSLASGEGSRSLGSLNWRNVLGRIAGKQQPCSSPRALRYGLWDVPASLRLPDTHGRWPALGALRRAIDRAAQQRQMLQIVIDSAAVNAANSAVIKQIDKLFAYADQQRAADRLFIEPIRAVIDRVSHVRRSTPAQSILRPRAA